MQIQDAKNLANELMEKHGLIQNGYQLGLTQMRPLGECNNTQKQILLNIDYVLLNESFLIKDTILHEIAHALTPGHHHDLVWKRKAIEIGSTGKRLKDRKNVIIPKRNYTITCPVCQYSHQAYKLTRQMQDSSCGYCSPRRYNAKYKFRIIDNRSGRIIQSGGE
jgi:predicted SprT family Zn-dependent metalloprotease